MEWLVLDLCVECLKEWPHCEDFPVKTVEPMGVSTLFSILKVVPAMAVQRGIWRKSSAHDLGADSGVESPMPPAANGNGTAAGGCRSQGPLISAENQNTFTINPLP